MSSREEHRLELRLLQVGPITAVTRSPASSFTMVLRQKVGSTPTATPVEQGTITIDGSTTFVMPGRFNELSGGRVGGDSVLDRQE